MQSPDNSLDILTIFTFYFWLNVVLTFLLGGAYSFVELINTFKTTRTFFNGWWGVFYVFLNGVLSLIALIAFKNEVSTTFLGTKILIAGTSALALLRTISIPIKYNNTSSNAVPMIEVVLNYVKTSYDRNKSKEDLIKIKPLMKDINCYKAAEELPLLCANMLKTLSEEDGKKMSEDIQKFLTLEHGNRELKSVNLGIIMANYVGYDLLKEAIDNTKEYISNDGNLDDSNNSSIESLIQRYQ